MMHDQLVIPTKFIKTIRFKYKNKEGATHTPKNCVKELQSIKLRTNCFRNVSFFIPHHITMNKCGKPKVIQWPFRHAKSVFYKFYYYFFRT